MPIIFIILALYFQHSSGSADHNDNHHHYRGPGKPLALYNARYVESEAWFPPDISQFPPPPPVHFPPHGFDEQNSVYSIAETHGFDDQNSVYSIPEASWNTLSSLPSSHFVYPFISGAFPLISPPNPLTLPYLPSIPPPADFLLPPVIPHFDLDRLPPLDYVYPPLGIGDLSLIIPEPISDVAHFEYSLNKVENIVSPPAVIAESYGQPYSVSPPASNIQNVKPPSIQQNYDAPPPPDYNIPQPPSPATHYLSEIIDSDYVPFSVIEDGEEEHQYGNHFESVVKLIEPHPSKKYVETTAAEESLEYLDYAEENDYGSFAEETPTEFLPQLPIIRRLVLPVISVKTKPITTVVETIERKHPVPQANSVATVSRVDTGVTSFVREGPSSVIVDTCNKCSTNLRRCPRKYRGPCRIIAKQWLRERRTMQSQKLF